VLLAAVRRWRAAGAAAGAQVAEVAP
jgi:hypothetical protein